MAIPLGQNLITSFSPIFIFIFVFAIIFGVLQASKIFKEAKNLYGIIAFILAILAIVNSDFVKMLTMILPWIAMMVIFFFLMFFILMFLGMDNNLILQVMGGPTKASTFWWVFGAVIFLVVWSLGSIMGQRYLESGTGLVGDDNSTLQDYQNNVDSSERATTATNNFQGNLTNILFHPAVLGMALILIIAMMALIMLTRDF